ncbi:MAG: fibronectin type III domain-containing protein [Acidobacteriaceae bacterium]
MVRNLPPLVRLGAVATLAIACAFALQVSLVGCGMEAAPQPPSLQLPKPVSDLTADRTGNQVHLAWNTPKENTDHLKLQGSVQMRVCRQQQAAFSCETVATISAAPDKPAQYTDVLPPALASGPVRPITYRIFGINKHGRSAGPSNVATVLAGKAPPEVRNLSAQVVERGVVLRWQPVSGLPPGTSIQIDRTLVTPPVSAKPAKTKSLNPLPRSKEPAQQKLRVSLLPADAQHTAPTDPGIALDPTAQFGLQYTYSASRVVQQQVGQQGLQLDSSQSPAVQVATRDTFPPAAPSGLVAVPVSAVMNNGAPEVDLSWSANTEPDLAQYRVYRLDVTTNQPMRRIAPQGDSASAADALVAPAYRDVHVQAGQTYTYAVTAVDASGNEGPRSAEVTVTVPTS